MTEIDSCLEAAARFSHTPERTDGKFWRSAQDKDFAVRFESAEKFGWRVKVKRWQKNSADGISTSIDGCASPECAIVLSELDSRGVHDPHNHVVGINLAQLSSELETPVVAQYDQTKNPCHYVLRPLDISIDDLFQRFERFVDSYATTKPVSPSEIERFHEDDARRNRVLEIHRDVRSHPTAP